MTAWVSCARAALICGRRVCACLLQRCLACVTAASGLRRLEVSPLRDCRRRSGRFGCCDCAMCEVSPGYASRCRRWLGLLAGSASLSCADSPSRIAWLCSLSGLGSLGSFLACGRDRPLAYCFPAFTWVVSPACCCGDRWSRSLGQSSVLLAACTSRTAAWRCSRPLAFGGSCAVSPPFESLLPACCLACCDCWCAPVECQLVFRGVAPEVSAEWVGWFVSALLSTGVACGGGSWGSLGLVILGKA